jgi:WD40 repeat protein/serine/threonine protein kinase
MSHPSADRNLLFGILAVQLDFVTKDALVAAMGAWLLDKAKPLGDVLRDQGHLSPDRLQLLTALVAEHLKQHGDDPQKSLAALSSIPPTLVPQLAALPDEAVQQSIAHIAVNLPTAPSPEPDPYETSPQPGPPRASIRYRILRPHAKGALGEVFVAEDTELGRSVALKEIQNRYADDATSRERFVREAEITGGLEHPGIVPVYGLGTYADGRPFYAMRFIQGDNLRQAIARFYEGDSSSARAGAKFDSLEFRQLLGRFIDVCNAVAYAHSRGVLHRDLKPGNVMLGKYGETLVVDWGLAKPAGRLERTSHPIDEAPLRPRSADTSSATVAGQVLGTPAYMSPEQAAGRLDDLGAASDIYSLGATLYELLTGEVPFADVNLDAVQKGLFLPPRAVNPMVPRPLEAVCLKAMERKPADRYGSALDLAKEVERWLADEPVSAWREPVSVRAWRWVRRHRTQVSVAAALLVAATVGFWLTALERERARLAVVNEQVETAKQRDLAIGAKHDAEKQRAAAVQRQLEAEESRYSADVRLAQQAIIDGDMGRATSLLERFRSVAGSVDYRGFEWRLLWRFCDGDSRATYRGFSDQVWCVAFSPDGKFMAGGSSDSTVRVFDAATREQVSLLHLDGAGLMSLAFSPDARTLACATGNWQTSQPGKLYLCDWRAGRAEGTYSGHEESINCLAFSRDGQHVATCGDDNSIILWRTTGPYSLVREARFGNHFRGVNAVGFTPDSRFLLAGFGDGHLQGWDVATKLPTADQRVHASGVMSLAFTSDSQTVLVGTRDGPILLWDVAERKTVDRLDGGQGQANSLSVSSDGQQFVSGGSDSSVTVWDLARRRAVTRLCGHQGSVQSVAFSPRGHTLASGSVDRTLKVWESDHKRDVPTLRYEAAVSSLAYSPDGRLLAVAGGAIAEPVSQSDKAGAPRRQKNIWLWKVGLAEPPAVLSGHDGVIYAVAFSPDGRTLASACEDGSAGLWDVTTGQRRVTLTGHTDAVVAANFSPDGAILATGSRDRSVNLWDAAGHQPRPLASLRGHENSVWSVAFSPDGKLLASASVDRTVRVWDVATRKVLAELRGFKGICSSVAFSPDGNLLAAASTDRTIRVWKVAGGKLPFEECGRLFGYKSAINSVAFSRDSKTLAAGGQDASIVLWNVSTKEEVAAFAGHKGGVSCVAFSPDGNALATGSNDQTVKIWHAGQDLSPRDSGPPPTGWTTP